LKLLSFSVAGAALLVSVAAASAQDAAAGEKVFAKCKICHQIGEGAKNMVGPVLNGVVGRHSGIYEGYHYSDANKNSGITWDEATLKEYLKDPKAKVPGTKMVFPGLTSDDDIANVIAYLKQFGPDGEKIGSHPPAGSTSPRDPTGQSSARATRSRSARRRRPLV
jgi:cytochrome c